MTKNSTFLNAVITFLQRSFHNSNAKNAKHQQEPGCYLRRSDDNFGIKATLLSVLFIICSVASIFGQQHAPSIQAHLRQEAEKNNWLASDISDWIQTDGYTDKSTGLTYAYINQRYNGIPVHNAISTFALKEGQIVHFSPAFIKGLEHKVNVSRPTIAAQEAIEFAIFHLEGKRPGIILPSDVNSENNHFSFDVPEYSNRDVSVQLVYTEASDRVMLAWNVSIEMKDNHNWWNVRIDAMNGNMINKDNYTVECNASYNVYPFPLEGPSFGSRSLLCDPHDALASPFGWHDHDGVAGAEFTITRGNNVFAYEDANNDNLPGYSPSSATLEFDYPVDLNQAPLVNQDAAITNLFYANNRIHDYLYHFGFDEVSGNFQHNNYGNGGQGNDAVNAEAQDGGGTNNANFSTPPDGTNGRMQMYLWQGTCGSLSITSSSFNGTMVANTAVFSPIGNVSGDLILVNDGLGNPTDACDPIQNVIAGKVVLIDRGTCTYYSKAQAAQNAGAIGVIITNNQPGGAPNMSGSPQLTIPVISVSQADGDILKTALLNGPVSAMINACNSMKDASFDNGIIAHEYGHGLSNRLTGGPSSSGCLSNQEQGGEGWSDWLTLMMTIEPGDIGPGFLNQARGIGTFSMGQPTNGPGIRNYPYCTNMTTNPLTYANLGVPPIGTQVHNIGEVWCSALWDMSSFLIEDHGFSTDPTVATAGNNIAMKLVLTGMKLQPCQPGFLDARDAILNADAILYNNAHRCRIWEAFARRGMGYDAVQGLSTSASDQTAGFAQPYFCGSPTQVPVADFTMSASLITCTGTIQFTDASVDAFNWSWHFGDGDTSNLQHPSHQYNSPGTYQVTLVVSNPLGSDSVTYSVTVDALYSVSSSATPNSICEYSMVQVDAVANGNSYSGYNVNNISYAPLTGTLTTVTLLDDQVSTAQPIGFPFTFFGQTYTEFYISSNGFISFSPGQPGGAVVGEVIPGAGLPNNMIALAWNDLNPENPGSTIGYFVTGTSPNQKLVVQYTTSHFGSASLPYVVQAILSEGSNEIEIHTTSITDASAFYPNPTTTQGIENANGTYGVTVPGRNSAIFSANNDAYRFVPFSNFTYSWQPGNLSGASQSVVALAGTNYTVSVADGNGCVVQSTAPLTVLSTPSTLICPSSVSVPYDPNGCSYVINYNQPIFGGCYACNPPASISGFDILGDHNGHRYFISQATSNPTDAQATALSLGAHLATITDSAENAFVQQAAIIRASNIIIGGSDANLEGTFEWVTGEPFIYTNWITGEPNNQGDEDYLEIQPNGRWNDIPLISLYYVLEFDCNGLQQTTGLPSGSLFPPGTTTNTFVYTDTSGQSVSCSFDVYIAEPVMVVGNDTVTICEGQQTTLEVSGNASGFIWAPAAGLNQTSGTSVIASPLTTTVYTVTSTDPNACTVTFTVIVNLLPVLNPSTNPFPVCLGEDITLNPDPFTIGGSNILQTPMAGGNGVAGNAFNITAQQTITLHYFSMGITSGTQAQVWYKPGGYGCANLTSSSGWILAGTVGITPAGGPPNLTLIPLDLNLTLNAGQTYGFVVVSNGNNYYTNGSSVCAPLVSNSQLTISQGHGGSGFNGAFSFTNSPRSFNGSITYNANSYSWSPGITLSDSTLSNPVIHAIAASETYTVTATSGAGCVSTATLPVVVNPAPVIVGSNVVTICEGESTTLTVTGASGYLWTPSLGLSQTNGSSVIASPLATTVYTITTTDPISCSKTILVNVNPKPALTTSASPNILCAGDQTQLNVVNAFNGNLFYTTGPTSIPIFDNSVSTSSILVSGAPANPVTGADIIVNLDITHTWNADLQIELHAPDGSIVILSDNRGGSGDNYTNTTFSSAAATPIASGTSPFTGTYLPDGLAAFNALSVNANGTWQLVVHDQAGGDLGTINNFSLTFSYPGAAVSSIIWTANPPSATANISDVNIANPTAIVHETTTYHVELTNLFGCTSTDSVLVTVEPVIACPADITVPVNSANCNAVVTYQLPFISSCFSCATPTSIPGYNLIGVHDGHTYFVSTTPLSWQNANAAAASLGGHLVTISSLAENNFVRQAATTLTWLGATTGEIIPEVWAWTNNEPFGYTNWAANEPSGNEHYLMMYPNGTWNDFIGSNTLQYIVEFDCAGLQQIAGLPSGTAFPIGTTTNVFEYTGDGGVRESCSFTVTVEDNTPTTIQCPTDITHYAVAGNCQLNGLDDAPVIPFNCNLDKVLSFDGQNDVVTAMIDVSETAYTAELWFKTSQPNTGLFSVSDSNPGSGGHDRHIYLSGGDLVVRTYNSEVIVTFGNNYADGEWHHVAHVLGGNGQRIYVDGYEKVIGVKASSDFTWQDRVHIGHAQDAVQKYFQGEMRGVRIWNTVRTQAELLQNMHVELTPQPGLQLNILFDQGVAGANNSGITTAPDLSGNNHNGTLNNFALIGTTSNWTYSGLSNNAPAIIPTGVTPVIWTITDATGVSASCIQQVEVIDSIAPVVVCPSNIVVNNNVGDCGAAVGYNVSVLDECTPSVTLSAEAGSPWINATGLMFNLTNNGAQPIAITSFDLPLDGTTQNLSVYFSTLLTSYETIVGNPSAWTLLGNATVNGINFSNLVNIPIGGLTLMPGETRGVCVNSDVSPAMAYNSSVNVGTSPIQTNGTLTMTSGVSVSGANLNLFTGTPGSVTNFRKMLGNVNYQTLGSISVSSGLLSGSAFPVGTTQQVYTITDIHGNSSTCSFDVTVNDTEAPTITCPQAITVNANSSGCNYTGILIPPTASDNCTGPVTVSGPVPAGPYTTGTTTVTWTATDSSGNSSTCTQDITVLPTTSNGSMSITSCGPYTWTATTFFVTGVYTKTFTNALGCDSVHVMYLTVTNSTSGSSAASACGSYNWNGTLYTSSGQYTQTFINANGCDSLHTLSLTIHPAASGTSSAAACYSYTWNSTTYTASGAYTQTFVNANGCDSLHTLQVTINGTTTGISQQQSCDSYSWNNTLYTTSGQYTHTYVNANGCDSVHTLDLTIIPSATGSSSATACDSYTWNTNTYTQSGTYTQTFMASNGCDSIHTLQLTINNSSSNTVAISAGGCYTWVINGNTYTTSGTYTHTSLNQAGCVHTEILQLTVSPQVVLQTRVILSGPYSAQTGLMHDSLRVNNYIPQTEPYSASPFFPAIGGAGNEQVDPTILAVSGPDAIVDWLYLELRSASNPATRIATKRALLQRDGDVVSHVDGASPVTFSGTPGGMYYISVKHRNHLGVMSAAAVYLAPCAGSSFDFTLPGVVYVNPVIANVPRRVFGSVHTLWAGDASVNKNTKYNGASNDKTPILNSVGIATPNNTVYGYREQDCNMDGKVRYNNTDNDRQEVLNNVGVSTPNAILFQHTPN
jgi:subtilisin-like proprotein convertase family protein